MKMALIFFAMLFWSFSVLAGEAAPGTLHTVGSAANGVLYLTTTGAHTGAPACAQTTLGRFAVNTSTPAGRVMAAHVMLLYAQGKMTKIYGSGTCDPAASNSESVGIIHDL